MKHWRKKWLLANPEKGAAHIILNNAIRDGRIKKGTKCHKCGSSKSLHGHHPDYCKPLEVEWLCCKCHTNYHAH
jgi:hypothetical protein